MVYLNIKQLLKDKKKTVYWLVKEMDSSYQSITPLIENETVSIKFETIDKLCRVLNCEPKDIIKRK